MELIHQLVDLFLHLDRHLYEVVAEYGFWTYALLFLIIFCETGLVVTPFLPGDSLLFAAGTLAAGALLNIHALFLLLVLAAVLGDASNYSIGRFVGLAVFKHESRVFKRKHLERTQEFYEKHGGKTIVMARFVPIVRTFAPFVAGAGKMHYPRFAAYNVIGGILWVAICLYAGYFFGSIPAVQSNFSLVVLGIIAVSLLPMIVEVMRNRLRTQRGEI